MTKYKQAIAIISNAPPLRLTYPKFARNENPPLSEREMCFQSVDDPELHFTPPTNESTEPSITQAVTRHHKEPETEKPPRQQPSKPKSSRWEAARAMASSKPSAQQELRFEPEYDPVSLDEEQMPLFDSGSREGR